MAERCVCSRLPTGGAPHGRISQSPRKPLIRKLDSIFTLSDDERQAILDLPLQVTNIKADQDIVREGDRPTRSCLVLEGFTCIYKLTGEGKRQIMGFNI